MSTQLDSSIGFKKETTFGTIATPDHFVEFTDEDFNWTPTFEQSKAQRYGRRVDAADRRVLTKDEAGGSFTVEALTKGLGALFEAALGTAVSTVITAPAYQQLITPAVNDFLPSYTVQKGIPLLGGAVQAQTYKGCVCSGFELTVGNAGIPTIKFNWLGQGVDTSTALAAVSYAAGLQELSFAYGSIALGGTVTLPTTTALATGGTPVADIRDINFTWDNGLDGGGFNLGGQGRRTRKPALGLRTGKGTLTAEYDNNTLRDAFMQQQDLALVLTFQHPTAIGDTNYPTLQLVIPDIRLEGELPKANGGDVVTQSIGYTLLDNRIAAQPLYIAIVTEETAI
jgi:hypothetical protein